ncbi:MAG: hypothetical protein KF857_03395 [Fimbriimonadaceae bacterium]|nr:hypothetical protein [Fimbriimonadaceae bacterium]
MAERRRDALSATFGLLTFLVGLALILFAFKLAYDIFTVPPRLAMEMKPGEPVALGKAADGMFQVVVRVVLLVAMAGFGSMVANRGIKLYAAERGRDKPLD